MTWIEEMTSYSRAERKKAWKEHIKERIGRESISPVEGYVVAGCVLDIIDDIWKNTDSILFKELEKSKKQHNDVYLYQMVRYPPYQADKKGFLIDLN